MIHNKIKKICMTTLAIALTLIQLGPISAFAKNTINNVTVNYYLVDSRFSGLEDDDYIGWDGNKVDPADRILLYTETVNYANQIPSNRYLKVAGHENQRFFAQLGYKNPTGDELSFGVYMENTVTAYDWNGEGQPDVHSNYVCYDYKSARFPDTLAEYDFATPSKPGYTFLGWYGEDGFQYNKNTKIYENTNIYAKYASNDASVGYMVTHRYEALDGQEERVDREVRQEKDGTVVLAKNAIRTDDPAYEFDPTKSDESITVRNGASNNLHIYYSLRQYDVKFDDGMGNVTSNKVKHGATTTAPADPNKENATFLGWFKEDGTKFDASTPVTYSSTYYAKYKDEEQTKFSVKFYDKDHILLQQGNVFKGSNVTPPAAPEVTGYHFTGWDSDEYQNVQKNLEINALYEKNQYHVNFYDREGNQIGGTQTINYQESATAPTAPEVEGYTFSGWDQDFTSVVKDMDITAQYNLKVFDVTFVD